MYLVRSGPDAFLLMADNGAVEVDAAGLALDTTTPTQTSTAPIARSRDTCSCR